MENYGGYPMNTMPEYAGGMEKMYPDSYLRVYPHVKDVVDSISDESMRHLSNDDVDRLADEAVRRSGALSDPPAGHTANTMTDLTRGLVVRDLVDRGRRRGFFPFFSPFFFFPFDFRDRDRFRDHDRDFDRDRDRHRDRDRDRDWY